MGTPYRYAVQVAVRAAPRYGCGAARTRTARSMTTWLLDLMGTR
ncbi:hypothetical protein NKH18_33375 [Streptomyces sp. M10(2022)]